MIKELWDGVSLTEFNKWYPLTGKITETPEQYIETWSDVEEWFKTFALRAQNDIDAYLNFALSTFDFASYPKQIKIIIIDMIFVCVEHWSYNRTPIEFNSDASMTWNNGQTQFNSFATPTINIWDLHPSRMKIWANLTQLKNIFDTAENGFVDPELIDLNQYYTKIQTDALLDKKAEKDNVYTKNETDELLDQKQDKLIDKKTIKTINDKSILGEGNFVIDKAEVGLSNVDNTSDKDKPISTASQNALNAKENTLTAKRLMEFLEKDEFYLTEGQSKIGNGPWGPKTILNKTITQDSNYQELKTSDKTLLGAINEINSRTPDPNSFYTKTETDNLLDKKANKDDVYIKTEVDALLDKKADKEIWEEIGTITAEKNRIDFNIEINAQYKLSFSEQLQSDLNISVEKQLYFKFLGGNLLALQLHSFTWYISSSNIQYITINISDDSINKNQRITFSSTGNVKVGLFSKLEILKH